MVAQTYSGFAQRYNMLIGILICALFTSILTLILLIGFFFLGDVFLVVGGGIGLYFTFKNRIESQSHIKTGIIVGLIGPVLSLILISFFFWIWSSLEFGFDFFIFLQWILSFFAYYGIFYLLVGIITGYLFGYYYRKKEVEMTKSPLIKKDFF